jgi:hypothetical protein
MRTVVNRAPSPALLDPEDTFFLAKETVMVRLWHTLLRARCLLAVAGTALALTGCGGSDGGNSRVDDSQNTGTVLVGLTDADGDFVSYTVDVLSVKLTRPGGASVETLPATTRVDFAQLTDLSDLLTVATLAPGDIVGGTLRLDYSNAEIFVEVGGQVVQAKVVDENGDPLGQTELKIELDPRRHLLVTRGRAAFLSLDFDLAASNDVDVTQSPPVVTARPYIVAEVEPIDGKELRLRGALVSTNPAASTYTVDLRPWFRPIGNHGRVTVHTTDATTFEIDGSAHEGSDGLAALAQKPAGTMTVAFGTLSLTERSFTASVVNAGASVSGEGIDAVHGNVVSRNGDELTVKGAFTVSRAHDLRLHRTVVINVGPDTKVLKAGDPDAVLATGAISVGQRIVAFGELTRASDATPATLDATAGRVRLLPTQLHGSVSGVITGRLSLNLRAIDWLGIDMFDFAGTGLTREQDADPTDYEVATGTMALTDLSVGEPTKVLGFVTPYGAAPPDFDGRTVIDRGDLLAVLGIGWGPDGTSAPFLTLDANGIVLDLANTEIGLRHALLIGRQIVDLFDLPASPTIVPADTRTVFGIATADHIELFTSFGEFTSAVAARFGSGDKAVSFVASGSYDAGANVLTARRATVFFATN